MEAEDLLWILAVALDDRNRLLSDAKEKQEELRTSICSSAALRLSTFRAIMETVAAPS